MVMMCIKVVCEELRKVRNTDPSDAVDTNAQLRGLVTEGTLAVAKLGAESFAELRDGGIVWNAENWASRRSRCLILAARGVSLRWCRERSVRNSGSRRRRRGLRRGRLVALPRYSRMRVGQIPAVGKPPLRLLSLVALAWRLGCL